MPREKPVRLLSSGFGDYDVELNWSKEPIKVKKLKMKKKRKNMRVLSTGVGDYDLEVNFGRDPIRIRDTKKEDFV